ncbi:unnamed protein product [Cunninghamella blakesleeana]
MTISNYHKHSSSIHSLLNPEPSSSMKKHGSYIKKHEVSSSNRPKRKRISPDQFRTLSDFFNETDTPNHELRDKISKLLNMTNREVQVWFQNRRAKVNRIKLQEQQKLKEEYFRQGINLYHHNNNNNYLSSSSSDHILLTSPPQSPPSLKSSTQFCDSPTSTVVSSPTSHYPPIPNFPSYNMSPIDILATAAEYVQKCDQEKIQYDKFRDHEWSTWS